jgi:peptide deformylase
MIVPILQLGDERLRRVAEEVVVGDPTIPDLVEDLLQTLRESAGLGLAAPQIGVNLRVIVVQHHTWPKAEVLVNPVILSFSSEKVSIPEGCLSVANQRVRIARSEVIRVGYYEPTLHWSQRGWVRAESTFSGLAAIIVQHEIDHLDGKLIVDHEDVGP